MILLPGSFRGSAGPAAGVPGFRWVVPVLAPALLLGALTLSSCSKSPARSMGLPNIILIALDTFRADHIASYGNRWIFTPALDDFAGESIVFERASAAAPWTLPSFGSMYTGLLPCEHGAVGGKYMKLASRHLTLAEFLQEKGYYTKGFVAVDLLTEEFGMDQGFHDLEAFVRGPVTGRINKYEDEVLAFCSRPSGRPYFLLVHYYDAHHPYTPPLPFNRMYYTGDPGRADEKSLAVIFGEDNRIMRPPEKFYSWLEGITDIQYPVRQYAAGITHVDHHLGTLLQHLRETGELDRSIVVILADHGEHLLEHSIYFTHRFPYEETLHIPLLVRLPGGKHGGLRIREEVSNVDLFPTLVDLLGLEMPVPCSGISLAPLMKGGAEEVPPRYLFAECGTPERYTRAVWLDRFRLVRHDRTGGLKQVSYELFDHAGDPREEVNVLDLHPEVFETLKAALEERFSGFEIPGGEGDLSADDSQVDQEAMDRLKELGYF